MNDISFSLYGRLPKYCVGAIRNAELMPSIYPGWKMVVYYREDVPADCLKQLRRLGAMLRPFEVSGGMFNRFLIGDDAGLDRWLVRDADSRLNERERKAVDEWIASRKSFHVIRDHPNHIWPITPGLFGGISGRLKGWKSRMSRYSGADDYGLDATFLEKEIWPLIQADCLHHDLCRKFPGSTPLPLRPGDYRFAGEVVDERDVPRDGDWQMRKPFMA